MKKEISPVATFAVIGLVVLVAGWFGYQQLFTTTPTPIDPTQFGGKAGLGMQVPGAQAPGQPPAGGQPPKP